MELMITVKGNKYTITDKAKNRLLYTVKKKGFSGAKFVLLDSSSYQLYSIVQFGEERKPSFDITHNENTFMKVTCKSLFLDPTIVFEGDGSVYQLTSKDHRNFDLIKDDAVMGHLKTAVTVSRDLQYEFDIENTIFDDYLVLFVVAIDRTFGEMNKK